MVVASVVEVERAVRQLRPDSRWDLARYVGGGISRLEFHGLTQPSLRARFKEGFSFSALNPREQWAFWDLVFRTSDLYEARAMALMYLESLPDKGFDLRAHVMDWSESLDNWALADGFCALAARYRDRDPVAMDRVYAGWERSTDPWQVRASMVGVYFYARMREKPAPVSPVLKRVARHLRHPHLYVQKATGWVLRECYQVDQKRTWTFLQQMASDIPPAGWYAAQEKLTASRRKQLGAIRWKNR